MIELLLEAHSLKKTFDHRTIFFDINFTLRLREGLGITGRNGSGKSTLAKIITGVLSPTSGEIHYTVGAEKLEQLRVQDYIGFVAPYLQLYDEFSAWENLDLARKIRGMHIPDYKLNTLLDRMNLIDRKDNLVRTYSSGMKQRLKYACALLHDPSVLILDEPTSSLDTEGVQIVHEIMKEQIEKGILVIATNEREDLLFCAQTIDLNVFVNATKNIKT